MFSDFTENDYFMNITIITDKNSWMCPYVVHLIERLSCMGNRVCSYDQPSDIHNKADIAFYLSCFQIVSKDILFKHKNNIVIHTSALPSGRGWSPMSWQILEGKNKIPLTLFEANEKVDAGEIYLEDQIVFSGHELISELHEKLGFKIIDMCVEFIKRYPDVVKQSRSQVGEASYYRRRLPSDSQLDVNKNIKDQFNLLRIVDNDRYPAYFILLGHKYKLLIEKVLD